VWFLAGTLGNRGAAPVRRSCIIPSNKAILLPVVNIECSVVEEDTEDTDELLRRASRLLGDKREAKINDEPVGPINIRSNRFEFVLPRDNIWQTPNGQRAPEGQTTAAADGYWVFIKNSAGLKTIDIEGQFHRTDIELSNVEVHYDINLV
jgi:hypothetical protein